ncbi:MAG: tetratricopeptide repeat protein [Chloroflexota bacterium]
MNQIHEAYHAAKSGDKLRARQIILEVLKSEPGNERAWFLYAKVAESRQKSIQALEKVVEINPFNSVASRDLELLKQRQAASSGGQSPQPSVSRSRSPLPSEKGGVPAWVWMAGAGLLGLLLLGCLGLLLIPGLSLPAAKPVASVAAPPVVQPTPTEDCNCAQATAYLDATYARFDIISSQLKAIEDALDANRLSQVDFFSYSAEAKALYGEQLNQPAPPCVQTFHTKTVSLLWNWQQSMQYAADEQYDAVDVFLQSFADEFAAVLSEGEKLGEKLQLQGCIQDPDSKPSL